MYENVTIRGGEMGKEEIGAYVDYVCQQNPNRKIETMTIEIDGDFVNLSYTGYLVGTTDRWNDAKKAEEKDRVKHAVSL